MTLKSLTKSNPLIQCICVNEVGSRGDNRPSQGQLWDEKGGRGCLSGRWLETSQDVSMHSLVPPSRTYSWNNYILSSHTTRLMRGDGYLRTEKGASKKITMRSCHKDKQVCLQRREMKHGKQMSSIDHFHKRFSSSAFHTAFDIQIHIQEPREFESFPFFCENINVCQVAACSSAAVKLSTHSSWSARLCAVTNLAIVLN